jgi:hypothetical protein
MKLLESIIDASHRAVAGDASAGLPGRALLQPFQGCWCAGVKPRVARSSQPWADRFESLQDSSRVLNLQTTAVDIEGRRVKFGERSLSLLTSAATKFKQRILKCE